MAPVFENQNGDSKTNLSDAKTRTSGIRRKVFIINCRLYMFVGAASIIIGIGMIVSSRLAPSKTGFAHDPAMNFIAAIMMIFGVIRIAVARRQLAKITHKS